ncbi:thioredoxin-disulfide reductase [Aerococcaceae bacterium DSM 109652]|uniref:Thioredoxin reductase n=1 Tax=Fundicoccus ignavus TaxID=2664442 RepID=A0A844C8A2_9LACT|nr:thioredoxin-disulfide reductase [Fundicoccus ignavus]
MNKERIEADVVVIGAGPGGLTAALYASRANLKTILLEKGAPGGELINTADVENYPGYSLIGGPELATNMYEGAMRFGAEHVYGDVTHIEIHGNERHIHTSDKVYVASAVVIATGAYNRKLAVEGEERLAGQGVSYCAVCDGFFFRNKNLVVVGGGDSAVEEGTYLTNFADKVTIVHRRDELRAQKILQDRAFANEKVDFIWDTVVEEVKGENAVNAVQLRNIKTNEVTDFAADGVFVYVGIVPNSAVVADLGVTDEEGWIVTNEKMETSVPGIYAVGDVRKTVLRQIATAVGDGSIAGHMAYQYIESLKD